MVNNFVKYRTCYPYPLNYISLFIGRMVKPKTGFGKTAYFEENGAAT